MSPDPEPVFGPATPALAAHFDTPCFEAVPSRSIHNGRHVIMETLEVEHLTLDSCPSPELNPCMSLGLFRKECSEVRLARYIDSCQGPPEFCGNCSHALVDGKLPQKEIKFPRSSGSVSLETPASFCDCRGICRQMSCGCRLHGNSSFALNAMGCSGFVKRARSIQKKTARFGGFIFFVPFLSGG